MSNRYNFFYFEAAFKKYLHAGNAGTATVKSYLSDLHFFFTWMQNDKEIIDLDLSDAPNIFTHTLVREYHEFLIASKIPASTYERRLSSLRQFFAFCITQAWLKSNPAHEFDKNTKRDQLNDIIGRFKDYLKTKKMNDVALARQISVIRSLIIN